MTAEVAILNRNAVALAADSAGSIAINNGFKIFASMDKIFSLSKYAPVAIMIYGSSAMSGHVPWEIIVKAFRKHLGKNKYFKLRDYASEFFKFIEDSRGFINLDLENQYILNKIAGCLNRLINEVNSKKIQISTAEKRVVEKRESKKILENEIISWTDGLLSGNFVDNLNLSDEEINAKLVVIDEAVEKIISTLFKEYKLTKKLESIIKRMNFLLLKKSYYSSNMTGLVFAGYGEEDYFPALISYTSDGSISQKLLYRNDMDVEMANGGLASIVPFAQKEMVETFLSGTAPNFIKESHKMLGYFMDQVVEMTIDAASKITGHDINDLKKIKRAIDPAKSNMLDAFLQQSQQFGWDNFAQPVLDIVGILPKDELGAMAESLVNLTSFKRRVSTDAETVSGPIDVAVISKGDGLVWIKRKHYFARELNHQFFSNYFEEE